METYRLKLLDREKDIRYQYTEIKLKPLSILKNKLEEFHQDIPYRKLSIPEEYIVLLKEALDNYNAPEYFDEFVAFIPQVQSCYLAYEETAFLYKDYSLIRRPSKTHFSDNV